MACSFTNLIHLSLANPHNRYGNRLQALPSYTSGRRRSPSTTVCHAASPQQEPPQDNKRWQACITAVLATAVVSSGMSAQADLNKYEADVRGEFGIGSAAQFGSADLKKAVHINENFRRANFTAADMRESNFSGSTFNGAYLEKAVAYKADFTGTSLQKLAEFLV